jgi:hypothetical protein
VNDGAGILAEVARIATFPGFTTDERLGRLREIVGPAPARYTKADYRRRLIERDQQVDAAVDCLSDGVLPYRRRIVAALYYLGAAIVGGDPELCDELEAVRTAAEAGSPP